MATYLNHLIEAVLTNANTLCLRAKKKKEKKKCIKKIVMYTPKTPILRKSME